MRRTFAFILLAFALSAGGCTYLNLHFDKQEPSPPKVAIAAPEEGFPGAHWELVQNTSCTVKKTAIGRKLYMAPTTQEGIVAAVEQITKNGRLVRQSKVILSAEGVVAAEAEVIVKNEIKVFSSDDPGDVVRMLDATLATLEISKTEMEACDMQPVTESTTQ